MIVAPPNNQWPNQEADSNDVDQVKAEDNEGQERDNDSRMTRTWKQRQWGANKRMPMRQGQGHWWVAVDDRISNNNDVMIKIRTRCWDRQPKPVVWGWVLIIEQFLDAQSINNTSTYSHSIGEIISLLLVTPPLLVSKKIISSLSVCQPDFQWVVGTAKFF